MGQHIYRRSFLKGGLAAAMVIAPIAGVVAAATKFYRMNKKNTERG